MKSIDTPALPASAVRWLALWALAACGAAPAVADEPEGRASLQTRIVGGVEAETGEWPWQVALDITTSEGRSLCGGSVIGPWWVLTAAHCVVENGVPLPTDKVKVLVGHHDRHAEDARWIGVHAVHAHEDYGRDRDLENDIALLALAEPAGVEAIELPDAERAGRIAAPGTTATVTGWGVQDARQTSSHLLEVEVPLVGERTCSDAYSDEAPDAAIDHRTLCAGLRQGGKDSCGGDSGGPLMVRDGDRWVQVGVVSWGIGCARPGKYGVYTSAGAFAQWVNETTGRELVVAGGAEAGTEEPSPEGVPAAEGAPTLPRGDRALLIGIDQYADPGLTDLQGAVNDAHSMRDLLTGYLGFDAERIRLLADEQATREGILAGIRDWLVAGTRPGARALLYYAGHGVQQPDGDGDEPDGRDEALAPHDVRIESATSHPQRYANLILDDEIGVLFDELSDRQAYLIVDSCFSGTITRSLVSPDPRVVRTVLPRSLRDAEREASRTRSAGLRGTDKGFIERKDTLIAWTAVASNQVALEDVEARRRQGVFTGRFVRGIAEKAADRDGDGRIVHSELLDYVRKESESYCARHQASCPSGLTPLLEGPPDVKARDVRDLAVVAAGASTTAAVADAALGHGNTAGVRLEILPSRQVRLGDVVTYRVRSGRSGHLLIVDVDAAGDVAQLFPNEYSERHGTGSRIEAGRPVEIPGPYYGFRLRVREPAGQGALFAIVTEDPVSLDDLAGAGQGLKVVPDAPRWLLAIGERLREPLTNEDGTHTRTRRWSYARVDYEIVR